MSEQMQPGRELDRLVAEAMGQKDFTHPIVYREEKSNRDGWLGDMVYCPHCGTGETGDVSESPIIIDELCVKPYSTDPAAAMEAWAWLEKNQTWGLIALGREQGKPAVLEIITDSQFEGCFMRPFAVGDTYPHAIALAVKIKKKVMEK